MKRLRDRNVSAQWLAAALCGVLAACGEESSVDETPADTVSDVSSPDAALDEVALPGECGECTDDEVCLGGRCLPAPACGCGFGEYCEDTTELCQPGCVSDENCGLGARCNETGQCTPYCNDDDGCAVGMTCEDNVCRPRCTIADQCGIRETCDEGVCVPVQCVATLECARGERCTDGTCQVAGELACEVDEACGKGWTCDDGRCVDCVIDDDCPFGRVCSEQQCQPSGTPPVQFETVQPPVLGDHAAGLIRDDILGYGPGAALADFDGDGAMDVVVGQVIPDDPAACIYLNRSTPGALNFERDEAFCGLNLAGPGIMAFEWDGAARRMAVIVQGRGIVSLALQTEDGWESRDLLESLPTEDPRRTCQAGTAVAVDVNLDGALDVVVACQEWGLEENFGNDHRENLVFLRQQDALVLSDDPQWEPLRDPGVTLAIAVTDLNADGLMDMVNANDSFSTVGRRNLEEARGHYLVRCEPNESCAYTSVPVVQGETAWGSFMGIGRLPVLGVDYLYLTDWGPKRMLDTTALPSNDLAEQFDLAQPSLNGFNLFSWSAVSHDWDGDGRSDLLVTHGMIPDSDVRGHDSHLNMLSVQQQDGTFVTFSEGFGAHTPGQRTPNHPAVPPSSRAALPSDFDGDGRMDLLIMHHLGFPEIMRHVQPESVQQCQLNLQPTVVPAAGYGFALSDAQGMWRDPIVQGHIRSGLANSVHPWTNEGLVRFPSGAQLPWSCADGVRQTIAEPRWLEPQPDPGIFVLDASVLTDGTVTSSAALVQGPDGSVREALFLRDAETNNWIVPGTTSGERVMLSLNGRWVPRWFEWEI